MAAGSAPTDLLALAANITDTYYGYDGKVGYFLQG